MDPAQLTSLPAMLSADRFAPYLAARTSQVDQAVRLYTWNIEAAAAAFWGPLHAFEVVLRNALNDQLTTHFGRPDWWTDPAVQLTHVMGKQLQQALTNAAKVAARNKRAQVPGDVVAAFTFGFWVGLTGKGGQLQYETRYWQPALVKAFPHYTGKRGALNEDLESVRLFRNRVAHHEPIFTRHLAADHATVLRLSSSISADAATYIDTHSRVPTVLANRQPAVSTGQTTSF